MNNGLTERFFVALSLSSSALAHTPDEERIAFWIALHDQRIRGAGLGAVSFDLSGGTADLACLSRFPWTFSNFAAQKAFLLSAIDDALQGHRWHREGYPEANQQIFDALAKFRRMVKRCREQYLDPETPYDLSSTPSTLPYPLGRCPAHGIVLHEARNPGDRRCIACNAEFPE